MSSAGVRGGQPCVQRLRWVQNGPGSAGFNNLGSSIRGGRNRGRGRQHDLIAAFPLESQGACSANPVLRPPQRVVGSGAGNVCELTTEFRPPSGR